MLILTAAGVVVAVVGVLVALGDWRLPVTDAGVTPPSSRSTVRPPVPPPDPTSSPTTDGTALTALEIKSGGANVKPLPRAIAANPAYAGGLAIGCPTNQSDDKARSVVFVLRQRCLDLDTTVRPYFPDDPADRVKVTAVAGVKQRDGSIATEVRAGYTGATGRRRADRRRVRGCRGAHTHRGVRERGRARGPPGHRHPGGVTGA
jgi:hypothetical protein